MEMEMEWNRPAGKESSRSARYIHFSIFHSPFSIYHQIIRNSNSAKGATKQHTVETVQHTAMSRKKYMSVIIMPVWRLMTENDRVADLAEHRADCTEHDRRPERHFKGQASGS